MGAAVRGGGVAGAGGRRVGPPGRAGVRRGAGRAGLSDPRRRRCRLLISGDGGAGGVGEETAEALRRAVEERALWQRRRQRQQCVGAASLEDMLRTRMDATILDSGRPSSREGREQQQQQQQQQKEQGKEEEEKEEEEEESEDEAVMRRVRPRRWPRRCPCRSGRRSRR